jgi:hypothetical protein
MQLARHGVATEIVGKRDAVLTQLLALHAPLGDEFVLVCLIVHISTNPNVSPGRLKNVLTYGFYVLFLEY